ncbi:MFS transporter [Pseudomonas bohemica]|uniref:MFS transporter n=1 Tax=Pseudomonas bohemica TaxID=2044872 RepID=UPI0022775269|nr:MFS transporter [Pseudomonas bohemica]
MPGLDDDRACSNVCHSGARAPALLIGARLLQGLCMGGEYATSAVYLSEVVPANRRGFYLGFVQVSVVGGQLFALALMLFMQYVWLSTSQIESWGWRIPFLIGGIFALFAAYIRRHVQELEPPRSQPPSLSPWKEMYRHWRLLLLVVGISVGGTVAFYTYTIYIQKLLINTHRRG